MQKIQKVPKITLKRMALYLLFLIAIGLQACTQEKSRKTTLWQMDLNGNNPVLATKIPFRYDGPKTFGIYQWNKTVSYDSALDQDIKSIGALPSYALYFTDLQRGFPTEILKYNSNRGVKTVLTQELCVYGDDLLSSYALDSINTGHWDEYFATLADKAKEYKGLLFYRFGYEMNGSWVAWGEQAPEFILAWQRVWRIFQARGADQVRWVFSPNILWGNRTFEEDILAYYPGDKYVDIVGLDGYNFGDKHSANHSWQSYSELFGPSMKGMKKYFSSKPIWVTEIGCADDERKAAWISDFIHRFNADPALQVFIWFNEDKQYAGEPNWRIDSDEASLENFRQWASGQNRLVFRSLPLAGQI